MRRSGAKCWAATKRLLRFLLAVFSIGIGVGSLLTDRLSGHKVEIGLVPLGSIGMTVFALDLYFASRVDDATAGAVLHGHASFWRVTVHGESSSIWRCYRPSLGLYSVPLYALIQSRAQKNPRRAHRRRQ